MARETSLGAHNRALHFRLVTEHRWITCHASTTHPRLVDLLNANPEQMILVQVDTLESRDGEVAPTEASAGYAAGISTGAILFGMPIEPNGATSAPRKSPSWVERSLWRARIGLGPYEIVGSLHLPKGTTLGEEVLKASAGFLVVTEATIRRPDGSRTQERVVAVNRARMDFMLSEPTGG